MNLRLELVYSETGKSKLHQGTLGADMSAANQRQYLHSKESRQKPLAAKKSSFNSPFRRSSIVSNLLKQQQSRCHNL